MYNEAPPPPLVLENDHIQAEQSDDLYVYTETAEDREQIKQQFTTHLVDFLYRQLIQVDWETLGQNEVQIEVNPQEFVNYLIDNHIPVSFINSLFVIDSNGNILSNTDTQFVITVSKPLGSAGVIKISMTQLSFPNAMTRNDSDADYINNALIINMNAGAFGAVPQTGINYVNVVQIGGAANKPMFLLSRSTADSPSGYGANVTRNFNFSTHKFPDIPTAITDSDAADLSFDLDMLYTEAQDILSELNTDGNLAVTETTSTQDSSREYVTE
jgi:hypothetical protein